MSLELTLCDFYERQQNIFKVISNERSAKGDILYNHQRLRVEISSRIRKEKGLRQRVVLDALDCDDTDKNLKYQYTCEHVTLFLLCRPGLRI